MSNRTTEKTNTFTLEANTPLSADEQAMLVRLAAMSDSDIDCSDIPPSSPDAKWNPLTGSVYLVERVTRAKPSLDPETKKTPLLKGGFPYFFHTDAFLSS
jgi:hypothetical protein